MVKDKKPFIDRKNAVTFHLVHRSQHDPLVADETAPQRVLLEAVKTPKQLQQQSNQSTPSEEPTKRRAEQRKYGILYDDDYNYLQHLKRPEREVAWEYVENPNQARKRLEEGNVTTAPKLTLPSSVFASEFEEDVGMLNKAAPQPGPRPDWDPDVVAALDDDFNFDDEANQLDDDFMMQAMDGADDAEGEDWIGEDGEDEEEQDFDSDDFNESDGEENGEIMDRLAPLMRERRFADFDDEETKSRFTEYSMSSSVIRRNEQLSLLDDRFEQFFASYDDPETGDLAMENIEGAWGDKHPYVLGCYKDFKTTKKPEEYKKEWDRERLTKYRNVVGEGEQDPNEELIEYEVEDPKQKRWDCESILSTYSNIYNHPKLIEEPRRHRQRIEIDPKTGLPTNVLRGSADQQLTAKALAKLDDSSADASAAGPKSLCAKSVISTLSVLSLRPKDETPEEKRERKRLLKEYRSERRIERKANAEAFKEEKKRQTHIKLNQRCNQQGKPIM